MNKRKMMWHFLLAPLFLGWVGPLQAQKASPVADSQTEGGAKLSLPFRIPNRDGLVQSGQFEAAGNAITLTLPVSRCVTARTPTPEALAAAVAQGLLTPRCKVTLYVFVERLEGSPDGVVTLRSLKRGGRLGVDWGIGQPGEPGVPNVPKVPELAPVPEFTLNGAKGLLAASPLITASRAEAADPAKWNRITLEVDATKFQFGTPRSFTSSLASGNRPLPPFSGPDVHVEDLFICNQTKPAIPYEPLPGLNLFNVETQSASAIPGSAMSYVTHGYGAVEFGAMAPILFIHGTNANHESWESPSESNRFSTIQGDNGETWTLDNQALVNPGDRAAGMNGKYAGPWFYKIDLGAAKAVEIKGVPDRSGQDRYLSESYVSDDRFGNASNRFSARQLQVLIPLVLEMYGLPRGKGAVCHLVAHSKGGSDCRYLVTNLIPMEAGTHNGLTNFQVQGFFSLGTPFRGTPVSDLAVAFRAGAGATGLQNGGVSPEVFQTVRAAATAVSLAVSLGQAPHGAALRDQRYHLEDGTSGFIDRNQSSPEMWAPFFTNRGNYFALAGDADVNGNRTIESAEGLVLSPAILHSLGLTVTSTLMGTMANNLILERDVPHGRAEIPRWLVKEGTLAANWIPNDLVTPYPSALPQEWEGQDSRFRLACRSFEDYFKAVRETRGSTAGMVLNAGNHSMMKSPALIDGIISKIKSLYPVSK